MEQIAMVKSILDNGMAQVAVQREDAGEADHTRLFQRVTELSRGQSVGDGDGDLVCALDERENIVSYDYAVVAEHAADNEYGGDVYHCLYNARESRSAVLLILAFASAPRASLALCCGL